MNICRSASGDAPEPAVRYTRLAACLGGHRGTPWSQLSGIGVLGEGEGEGEDECEEEGTGTNA